MIELEIKLVVRGANEAHGKEEYIHLLPEIKDYGRLDLRMICKCQI